MTSRERISRYLFRLASRVLFERLVSHALQCITDAGFPHDRLPLALRQRLLQNSRKCFLILVGELFDLFYDRPQSIDHSAPRFHWAL